MSNWAEISEALELKVNEILTRQGGAEASS